jgi:hypothetical protein
MDMLRALMSVRIRPVSEYTATSERRQSGAVRFMDSAVSGTHGPLARASARIDGRSTYSKSYDLQVIRIRAGLSETRTVPGGSLFLARGS